MTIKNLPAVIPKPKQEASDSEGMGLASAPNRQDALFAKNPERRCVATKRNGEQCRHFAIAGGTVCKYHGGATRHILNKARIRVQNNADKLMRVMLEFAYDETKDPSIRLKAIQDGLNRAGLQPVQTVEIGPTKAYEEIFDEISGGSREESRARRNETSDSSRTYVDYGPDWPQERDQGSPIRGQGQNSQIASEAKSEAHRLGDEALEIAAKLTRLREIES